MLSQLSSAVQAPGISIDQLVYSRQHYAAGASCFHPHGIAGSEPSGSQRIDGDRDLVLG